jgi:hypothetical protein
MRWATSGERYAPPAETARMPAISSRGSPDLSTKPWTPRPRARSMNSSSENVVSIMREVPGATRRSSLAAPSPSRRGILMSSRAMSGRYLSVNATASRPSAASATTSIPGSVVRMVRTPTRIIASSSASSKRITWPA